MYHVFVKNKPILHMIMTKKFVLGDMQIVAFLLHGATGRYFLRHSPLTA